MEYNNHELIITYKRIKRLNARIRDNKILVSAPYFTKDEVIFNFLDSNKARIEKMFSNQVNTDPNVMYVWGKKYNIVKIESDENKVVLMEDIAYVFYKKDYLEVIDNYYKDQTFEEIKNLSYRYKNIMIENKIMYNKLSVKKMKSRWGSCLVSKKNITINSNLAKYDKLCIEYVFCHEIAHIKYPNHSKSFHDFIYTYFKYEKEARKNLKKHY